MNLYDNLDTWHFGVDDNWVWQHWKVDITSQQKGEQDTEQTYIWFEKIFMEVYI